MQDFEAGPFTGHRVFRLSINDADDPDREVQRGLAKAEKLL